MCLTLVEFKKGSHVVMKFCDDSENQEWRIREGNFLQHTKLNICLDTKFSIERGGITAERCNSALDSQRWQFDTRVA